MTLHNCVKPRTNQIIGSLLKTHFVKTKHIKMRRDINEFFVSPEHLQKWSYEVLTRHHQYIFHFFAGHSVERIQISNSPKNWQIDEKMLI